MDTNILLENGTNELEVLEFLIGNNHYGINVAKVREIISYQEVTPVPNADPSIEGVFIPRDVMITVVNLEKHLNLKADEDRSTDMLIICNFNQLNVAFHVQKIVGIHRLSWEAIMVPDNSINNPETSVSTGIIKIDGRLIVILDFEKIITDISPETGLKVSAIEDMGPRVQRADIPIFMAEDSALLSKLIKDALSKAGYTNVTSFGNGKACYDKLEELKEKGTVNDVCKCIITDIEMPVMDGHRLTKLVKEDPDIKGIPLIIFSSLINQEMFAKGKALGADAQLSKPEIGQLVETIDGLVS